MPTRGDDHVRRAHLAKARQILPGCVDLKARERSRVIAQALGLSLKRAEVIRIEAERQAVEEAELSVPAAVAGRERFCSAIANLIERAERLFAVAEDDRNVNGGVGAIKQLHALYADLAKWQGARPLEDADDQGTRPVTFAFGGPDE